jgi:hypothetical protein
MPYSKDPSTYPPEYAAIFQRAIREDFEIDAGERGAAINFCHKLHAYRRAIETHKSDGWSALRQTTIRVVGTRVTFSNNADLMANIRNAVGIAAPSETELDAYLDQLEKGEAHDGESKEPGHNVQQPSSGEQELPGSEESQEVQDHKPIQEGQNSSN